MHLTLRKWIAVNSVLLALLAAAMVAAMAMGSGRVTLSDAMGADSKARAILFLARLPRAILAALVGMALASAGGAFQALLRNPLADPFILGVSGGAALGSVAAVGLHLPFAWISAAAFLGAAVAMLVIFAIAGVRRGLDSTTLLLTGVIFNAFCFALILFINAVVTMEEAYQIIFLLIGNLEVTDMGTVGVVAIFVIAGFGTLCLYSGRMNLLSAGDEDAMAMGVDIKRLRAIVFVAASVMVGAAVAASGLIGFVGLFIPHIMRLLTGSDNRLLIPASGLAGAAFLVAADAAARTLLMNTGYATQLPVGVITALVGAPLFMVLLRKQMRKA
ncbi:MAG: iron ABC transporter permease [Pseudomonadota bacterium]